MGDPECFRARAPGLPRHGEYSPGGRKAYFRRATRTSHVLIAVAIIEVERLAISSPKDAIGIFLKPGSRIWNVRQEMRRPTLSSRSLGCRTAFFRDSVPPLSDVL